jgi:hypothetical protein
VSSKGGAMVPSCTMVDSVRDMQGLLFNLKNNSEVKVGFVSGPDLVGPAKYGILRLRLRMTAF